MKLDDIIALAKQGYKPSDIKELIELSKDSTEEVETIQGDAPADGGESDHTTQESEPTETTETETVIDYKKLYEEEHDKLLNAQRNNINQNMGLNDKSDEDVINEFFKKFN